MKIKIVLIVIVFFIASKFYAQISDNCVANTLLKAYSERAYSSEPVTDQQLDLILRCGLRAPSAHNRQPWKFTVIKDETVQKEIVNDTIPGDVLIVISGIESESGKDGANVQDQLNQATQKIDQDIQDHNGYPIKTGS